MLSDFDDISWIDSIPPEETRAILGALFRVFHLITVLTDLDVLLEEIMEVGKQVAAAEACSLMLFDPAHGVLYFHVAIGEEGNQQALKHEVRLKLNQGIAGLAAGTRRSINVPDASKDPRVFREADLASDFQTRSILAVPLVDADGLVGVIEVLNKVGGGAFTTLDQRVMEVFASVVATAITNARLIDKNLRSERLAAIGVVVASMSHYTKNIITGMNGSVELIDQALIQERPELLRKGWSLLKRSVERISSVVEDMLAYSKPRRPMVSACSFADIVNDAAQTFEGTLHQKQVDFSTDTSSIDRPVHVDARAMYRCILNLLSNATFVVSEKTGRIRLRSWINSVGDLEIEFSDNGPGIPEDLRDKIFDPFFSTKGNQGTGLGLAVTHKLIKEHGGSIRAGNLKSGGACFQIVIPQPKGA